MSDSTIHRHRLVRYAWIALGTVSLILGTAGIVLPVLPTVPFYLLTAFCYAKSSERLHMWFLSTTVYQKYVEPFKDRREMPLKRKITILLTVTGTMWFSAYMMRHNEGVFIFLAVLWGLQMGGMIYAMRPRRPKEEPVRID